MRKGHVQQNWQRKVNKPVDQYDVKYPEQTRMVMANVWSSAQNLKIADKTPE